jgi:hypothetical protein
LNSHGSDAETIVDRGEKRRGLRIGAGAVLTILGAAALFDLWRRGLPFRDASGLGPAFFPAILAVALCTLGPLFALTGDTSTTPDDGQEETAGPIPMMKFTALLAALIVAFPWLGGLLSFSLFVALEMIWVERRSIVVGLLSGAGAFAIIWFLFIWLLAVPLPGGVLAIPMS